MKSMNDATSEIKPPLPQALSDEFGEILGCVQTMFQQGRTAHAVETGLWERMLKLGRSIFGAWLELSGDGDAGDRMVLEDGREVRRLEALHRREIQNVFGLFPLHRVVYGTREGQKIEAVPLDQRLGRPQGKNSSPFKVSFYALSNLAVEMWGCFGFCVRFCPGFFGPLLCFRNFARSTFLASCCSIAMKRWLLMS